MVSKSSAINLTIVALLCILAALCLVVYPESYIGFDLDVKSDDGIERIDGTGHYRQSETVTVTAVVKNGYLFDGWYGEDGELKSPDKSYTFLATKEKLYARSERGAFIEVSHSEGLLATVGGTYKIGDEVSLEAFVCRKGVSFTGWYVDGTDLMTKDWQCSFTATADTKMVARSDSDYFSGSDRLTWNFDCKNLNDSVVILSDAYTKNYIETYKDASEGYADLIPGKYSITLKGTDSEDNPRSETIISEIEGDFTRTYCWENLRRPADAFGSGTYSLTSFETIEWKVSYDELKSFRESQSNRATTTESGRISFVEYSSESMKNLAEALWNNTAGMSDLERAEYVLKFVQRYTDYQLDSDYNGRAEYWKYPLETILDRSGDCEDTSCLYCSLMKLMGYDVVLLIFDGWEYDTGHAAAGIALDDAEGGVYYQIDGEGPKYYFCETTSNYMFVGERTEGYNRASILRIP
jgi:hypothetical protein